MQFAAYSKIERIAGRDEALRVERLAIETEYPIFNKQWNDTPEARERLRGYLAARGMPDLLEEKMAMLASADESHALMSPLLPAASRSSRTRRRNAQRSSPEPNFPAPDMIYEPEPETTITVISAPQRPVSLIVIDTGYRAEVYLDPATARGVGEALIRHAETSCRPDRSDRGAVMRETSTTFTEGTAHPRETSGRRG
jgi:hypothetical protein